jgi:hypothetical protein
MQINITFDLIRKTFKYCEAAKLMFSIIQVLSLATNYNIVFLKVELSAQYLSSSFK